MATKMRNGGTAVLGLVALLLTAPPAAAQTSPAPAIGDSEPLNRGHDAARDAGGGRDFRHVLPARAGPRPAGRRSRHHRTCVGLGRHRRSGRLHRDQRARRRWRAAAAGGSADSGYGHLHPCDAKPHDSGHHRRHRRRNRSGRPSGVWGRTDRPRVRQLGRSRGPDSSCWRSAVRSACTTRSRSAS